MNALQMRELLLYLRDVIGRGFGNFITKRPGGPGVFEEISGFAGCCLYDQRRRRC